MLGTATRNEWSVVSAPSRFRAWQETAMQMASVNAQGPFAGQPRPHRSCRSRHTGTPSPTWGSLPTPFPSVLDTAQAPIDVVGRVLTGSKAETSGAKGAVMVHGGPPGPEGHRVVVDIESSRWLQVPVKKSEQSRLHELREPNRPLQPSPGG